jgi:3-methyladenine DNA glycosylase AlkC
MASESPNANRRAVRRLSDVTPAVHEMLASGTVETLNWTEWMATDMPDLARNVAGATRYGHLRSALLMAAERAAGQQVLGRLATFGATLAAALKSHTDPAFRELASHRSDVVRQWAAYTVNAKAQRMPLAKRLSLTLRFASDHHMSVRECAWMAFRPYLAANLEEGLSMLEPVSRAPDANLRRFAVEVTRPRSVWGAHIQALKNDPERAIYLLDNVRSDESRYVRLSTGNWLNDASKSRPNWVLAVASRWLKSGNAHTKAIVDRGMRTLKRLEDAQTGYSPSLPLERSAA